ncbi:type 2 lantipeptide synthetase LanM, partial [Streptomyces anulatus]
MAEKDLIDRGTTRRPAPAVSVVSAPGSSSVTPVASGTPVTPVASGTAATAAFGGAAGEPWWLPGVVGGSASGEPGWAVFAREAVASAPRDVVVADRAYPGLSGFGPVVAPFVEAATRRLRDALAEDGPAVDGSVGGRATGGPAPDL